jgi:predicted HTH domain antitoxin
MSVPIVIIETPVPEDIYLTLQASGVFREALAERSRQLLAVRFYQERILSLGKAARLAGLDRWQFIDLLSENQVAVIDYSDEELAAEFAAVDRLADELRP